MIVVAVTGRIDSAAFQEAEAAASLLAVEHKRDLRAEITPMLEREWSAFILQEKTVRGDAWGLAEEVFITVDGELHTSAAAFCDWVKSSYGVEADSGFDYEAIAKDAYKKHVANPDRDFVYMDIKIGDTEAGKIIIELYSDICPKTCENFKQLCTGEGKSKADGRAGVALALKGTLFHRIQADGWAQGGDIIDGTGKNGDSIYGETFPDENFIVKHSGRGVLAMANSGLHTNASQFLISFRALEWMNEQYVAFGQLVEGSATLKAIEGANTSSSGRPTSDIVIADCGEYVV